ncbi:MAG TPA: histidine kinase dimerization/phospho-acceptor domain-containing protein, partial [bacterium]|nr:histidine kinase dimerization/phospho-acceptor domain-containing protein [bacterium]
MRRRLIWRLFPAFAAVVVTAIFLFSFTAFRIFDHFHLARVTEELKAQAALAEPILRTAPDRQQAARELGERTGTRFTVILPDGTVAADSAEDPAQMANHGDRPEVKSAFAGLVGVSSRYSPTLQKNLLYVALRVREEGRTVFILRAAKPLARVKEAVMPILGVILFAALLIATAAVVASYLVARWMSIPLRYLQEGAGRFAMGELDRRLPLPETEEFAQLARSLNAMAEELGDRIRTITGQRNELETLLTSMEEALVVVNGDGLVTRLNRAAGALFHVAPDEAAGKPAIAIVRNRALNDLIGEVLATGQAGQREVELYDSDGRVLMAHGTIVPGAERTALFVFNDVTRLKKLENIRKEFVANVSHELRTPITSIKGYVETLRDGAINDPANTRAFLDTIARQSDRLGAIIEDLLALSKIERETEQGGIVRQPTALRGVMEAAVQPFRERAAARGIRIVTTGDGGLTIPANGALLEQALVNLIDNAVKYSSDNGQITMEARRTGAEATISVADTGVGIPSEHLPRLFERFYRVDKARSRTVGGTGLGL